MKFTPERKFPRGFAGFWKMNEGDVVEGVIRDVVDGDFGKSLIIALTKPLVVEQKDRTTGELKDYKAKAGEFVGLNIKANLKGLEKFVDHAVKIKYLGKTKLEGGLTEHQFDTDVLDKVPPPKATASA